MSRGLGANESLVLLVGEFNCKIGLGGGHREAVNGGRGSGEGVGKGMVEEVRKNGRMNEKAKLLSKSSQKIGIWQDRIVIDHGV